VAANKSERKKNKQQHNTHTNKLKHSNKLTNQLKGIASRVNARVLRKWMGAEDSAALLWICVLFKIRKSSCMYVCSRRVLSTSRPFMLTA